MERLKKLGLVVTAYTLLLGALALMQPAVSHSQVARQVVRVLQNGPNDAVPVTIQGSGIGAGNVNVVNTPNVNVVNTPNVHVTSLPAVQVSSSVDSPLFTRNVNDAVEPIQVDYDITFTSGTTPFTTIYAVPADRRLAIEFVSSVGFTPVADRVTRLQITLGAGPTPRHFFPYEDLGTEVAAFGQRVGALHSPTHMIPLANC